MKDFPRTTDAYIAEGWRVFPVITGGKTPAVDGWQTFNPIGYEFNGHNVGLPTGEGNGIVVLDVDAMHGGYESLAELEEQHGVLPETLRSITANGGAHYFFRHPGKGPLGNGVAIYGMPGVDVRGDGGYVVVPPSKLDANRVYAWDEGSTKDVAPLPTWIAEHKQKRVAPSETQDDEHYPEGTRNDSLSRVAGSLRHFGTPQDVLERTLLELNEAKCNPPLSVDEVTAIARSVGRYKQGHLPKPQPKPQSLSVSAATFVSMEVKAAKWLATEIWPEEAVGFVAGMGKSFKSFLALELGYSLATGADFLRKFPVPEARKVLLIQQESSLGAYQVRVANVARRLGPTDNLSIVSNKHLSLESDTDIERIENEIARVRPALLILDPLASFLHGDENSAQNMGEVVSTLRRLRDDYGCAICIVHHNRKDGAAMRGSTALYNASEVTIKMQRTADREALTSDVSVELKEYEGPYPFTVRMDSETCELAIRDSASDTVPVDVAQAYWLEDREGQNGRNH